MKYSYNWLQQHIVEQLPAPEVLKETIIFHAFEVEDAEEKNADTIFDIKVLPDRAGDCLSHFGMAREIAGLLKLTLKETAVVPLPELPLALPVEIKSDACTRYIAVQIDGVNVAPSPAWLKDALESVGQRSINNIVDATNYVLLDTGQPTHAFDRAGIDGGITVRMAHEGETIVTLSDEPKTLNNSMLVVADYVGGLAIAGVKGGKAAQVTEATASVVLEIAHFDATSVRKTSRSLGLITDASKRFENNFSSLLAGSAAAQLVALITDVAGGTVVGVSDTYPHPQEPRSISFTLADITKLLGQTVTAYTIEDVFDAYKYGYEKEREKNDGSFTLTVPWWRADMTGAHDIAEEVGRVNGYGTIPATPLPFTPTVERNAVYDTVAAVKTFLVNKRFSEVMTYSFRTKGEVYVAYGSKDKSALRTNLSDSLAESYERNRQNAPLLGMQQIKLFEVGTVFATAGEALHVATVDGGTVQELPIEAFVAQYGIAINVTDSRIAAAPASPVHAFKPWSVYPFIVRDIAVWLPEGDMHAHAELARIVLAFAPEMLARPATMFDTFSKDGRTSYAYRFVFQASDHTLVDDEVNALFHTLTEQVAKIAGAEIR